MHAHLSVTDSTKITHINKRNHEKHYSHCLDVWVQYFCIVGLKLINWQDTHLCLQPVVSVWYLYHVAVESLIWTWHRTADLEAVCTHTEVWALLVPQTDVDWQHGATDSPASEDAASSLTHGINLVLYSSPCSKFLEIKIKHDNALNKYQNIKI